MAKKREKKFGRNSPCWCGSGKKYKHCHLDREKLPKVTLDELLKSTKRLLAKKYCLHPLASETDCNGGIIRAHTIQRSGGLSRIARDGHIYGFIPDIVKMVKGDDYLEPVLLGISKASAFTGFCQKHDNDTFKPLEIIPFSFTPQQCFLLSYRALCKEVFAKNLLRCSTEIMRQQDKGKDIYAQMEIQEFANNMNIGAEVSFRELTLSKQDYDKCLLEHNYADFKYLVIRIDRVPEVMCSGLFYPEISFNNSQIQDLADIDAFPEHLTCSVIAAEAGGAIVFGWLPHKTTIAELFIDSLRKIDNTDIPSAIVRFIFSTFENTFFSPDWWDTLPKYQKEQVKKWLGRLSPPGYHYDGLRIVNWKIEAIYP